mmetsp:Transcript_16102/g.18055  ORF Transcript_16102/g.18055 Transcript_16102/m.18055 type:complete len:96 (+) Transcript_16102:156-443(+)|eukprot:CAMPEP_0170764762 /NCGR_PEP_ID=MMETSP0733-20121128/4205_1 /TAXON_ID=186038 /ORGANISM="Fragilariopsis kerguelensis, Strain L26-C5" /LENGTH=95 /DNA_ID=CAMNT_0011105489 /DNA_START=57 /DNA_END=344 /DNA_ORIENTATION=+
MTKMVSNVTFAIADGKMDEFVSYLNSIKDDVKAWDGMDSFAFAKASETSMVAWAVYQDSAAMEANAGKFKAALGGAASMFAGPPGRVIAEIVVQE